MTEDVLVRYEAAVDRLPPLTRFVFLLSRVDDLTYRQIADRLGIETSAVECGLAEAIMMIAIFLDGDTPRAAQTAGAGRNRSSPASPGLLRAQITPIAHSHRLG